MPEYKVQVPRNPQRARGKARFEILLDSVDVLLGDREAGEIAIQDVAVHSGVPLASVYHYFPSNGALLVGLARRYQLGMERVITMPMQHCGLQSWAEICRIHFTRVRRYFADHPIAMKLLLGADCRPQVRLADLDSNLHFGRIQFEAYHRHFILPEGEGLVDRCAIGITISDSIRSLSYSRHRAITDEMAEEACQARIAYLRLYLPDRAEKRAVPLP